MEEGLSIEVPAVVQFLNVAFADFIKIDGFRYTQVSTVRGIPRVETNLNRHNALCRSCYTFRS